MKQFSLEEYLKKPERKVVTRDGRNARIRCTDVKREYYPVLALVDNGDYESSVLYTENGEYSFGEERSLDLFFAPEKHEGWINIYRHSIRGYEAGLVHDNEADAKKDCLSDCIATIKIEWEE